MKDLGYKPTIGELVRISVYRLSGEEVENQQRYYRKLTNEQRKKIKLEKEVETYFKNRKWRGW